MNARRLKSTTLAVLSALVGMLALWSAVAAGQVTHTHLFDITEVPGNSAASVTGPLNPLYRMTVSAGELFTLGTGQEVNAFNDTSGAFISQFPQSPSLKYEAHGLAVSNTTGEVYVTADVPAEGGEEGAREAVVAVFDETGKLEATWNGADTPFGSIPCFECQDLAVDNSTSVSDPAAGDVYVLQSDLKVVNVFNPAPGGGETYVTQLTGIEPGVPFTAPTGVVVDPSGRVLVLDGEGVDIFEPTVLNEYVFVERMTVPPPGLFGASYLAVDGGNGDIYTLTTGYDYSIPGYTATVSQFNAAGAYQGSITGDSAGPFESVGAIAVDPTTHDLYVGLFERNHGLVDVLGPSVVAPDVTTGAASAVKPEGATLSGTVNPVNTGAATCQFDYGTSASFGTVAPCPAPIPDGGSPVEVQAQISGLKPGTTYYYRLEATNGNATNFGTTTETKTFTTTGPIIDRESASAVTSVSSTLKAGVDPNNYATSYYFQFGTSAAYGTDVPAAPGIMLGSNPGDIPVNVHLQSLTPNTTYHFRVVTVAEVGGEPYTLPGPDKTFITQRAGAELASPDGRRWEMVTPPDKQGAGILAIGQKFGNLVQAAENGDGIVFGANSPFVKDPEGSRSIEVTPVISKRQAPGRWDSHDISTPHNEGPSQLALSHEDEYQMFSGDLSEAIVEPAGRTPLPPLPEGSEKTAYLRNSAGEFKALVTSANVPAGTHFGGNGETYGGFQAVNASRDLSHIALYETVPLTSTPFEECGATVIWSAGNLACAGVNLGGRFPPSRHGISDDGSRVIGPGEGEHKGIQLHDMLTNEFVQVDAAQGTAEPQLSNSYYDIASSDGSRVFFTSAQRLTADSTAMPGLANEEFKPGDADLYEFELTSAKGAPLAGKLTDLTVDPIARQSAGVQGVIGTSEDGSSVYFVATGVLGDGAEHGAIKGYNLYVENYDSTTKSWRAPHFIAALSSKDAPTWGDGATNLDLLTARVSPNGRFLVFMSERSLTGYDNTDAISGAADEEVFNYDASSGRLVCTSCDPTGAKPTGIFISERSNEHLVSWTPFLWENRWLSGNVPGWTNVNYVQARYQSRYLSNSGRTFFNSSDALVPADVNGKEDVYQYEPTGVGGCQPPSYGESQSVVFSEAMDGCVGLISTGTSTEESAFMDASESGGDVFFITTSPISPQDVDDSLDIYDAHVCTTSAPCAPAAALAPPPCSTGDGCKAAPTPQPTLFGAPSSQTFSGAGNIVPSGSKPTGKPKPTGRAVKLSKALKACRKKPRRGRGACERRARKRYAAKRAHTGNSLSARTRR